jgi:hypothetical protein
LAVRALVPGNRVGRETGSLSKPLGLGLQKYAGKERTPIIGRMRQLQPPFEQAANLR